LRQFYILIIGVSNVLWTKHVLQWKWVSIFVTVLSVPINPLKPNGHYMYRQFNIQQFYVLPTQPYLCFVWIWEQTAIMSLYNTNWLAFITETDCVYCAVRTESLNLTQFKFYWKIRGSLCSIPGESMSGCGGRSGTGAVFLRILRFSTVSIIPPKLHTYLGLRAALTRTRLGTFRKSGSAGYKSTFTFCLQRVDHWHPGSSVHWSLCFFLSRCVQAVSRYAKLLSQPDVRLYNHLRGVAVAHGNLHSLPTEVNSQHILKLKQSAIPTLRLTH
jgi:hypothetical protein